MANSDYLPLTETIVPESAESLRAAIKTASRARTPIYPLGGKTALNYGLVAKRPGLGLSLAGLNRIIDYPARDLTITVEAGLTMQELSATLAAEKQRLPIDVPAPEQATIGGVIATNWSGPRRFGNGTIRDYVIGISAVDGRGMPFSGGGRVVKNVAGYDFCKLLTGSLGALGLLTQVTLKVKPIPVKSATILCVPRDTGEAERILTSLNTSAVTPAVVEWLDGPAWHSDPAIGSLAKNGTGVLAILIEGTAREVDWMESALIAEWRELGVASSITLAAADTRELLSRISEFAADQTAPLVLKLSVRPSQVFALIEVARDVDRGCSVQAHIGNGIVLVKFPNFTAGEIGPSLTGKLQPFAAKAGGHATVVSWNAGGELTHQAAFGSAGESGHWMTSVKRQFDPHGILNPGRFVV